MFCSAPAKEYTPLLPHQQGSSVLSCHNWHLSRDTKGRPVRSWLRETQGWEKRQKERPYLKTAERSSRKREKLKEALEKERSWKKSYRKKRSGRGPILLKDARGWEKPYRAHMLQFPLAGRRCSYCFYRWILQDWPRDPRMEKQCQDLRQWHPCHHQLSTNCGTFSSGLCVWAMVWTHQYSNRFCFCCQHSDATRTLLCKRNNKCTVICTFLAHEMVPGPLLRILLHSAYSFSFLSARP